MSKAENFKLVAGVLVFGFIVIMLLGGCSANNDVAPMVTVVAKADTPPVPAECFTADPSWQNLPDADVKQSELARNYAANKRNYRRVVGNRSICRAGLKAQSGG
jgi:hypothetical protein